MIKDNRYSRMLVGIGFFVFLIQIAIPVLGDDAYFASQHLSMDWLLWRYQEWTSRLIIEAMLVFMSHHMWLFRACTSVVVVLLLDSLARLTWGPSCRTLMAIIGLCFTFPATLFLSAGWVATSMNYLWPISIAIFVWVRSRQELVASQMLGYSCLLVFAANQEQVAAVLCGAFALSSMYSFLRDKRRFRSDALFLAISVFQFAAILLSPGNASRTIQTAEAEFPEFLTYSIWDKIQLGVSNTGKYLFFQQNILFFFLLICLALLFIGQKRRYAGLSLLPLFVLPINTLLASLERSGYTATAFTQYLVEKQGNPSLGKILDLLATVFTREVSLVWNGLFICLFGLLTFLLYRVEKRYELPLFLLAGIGSYAMLGFSPSIFMSGDRPAVILYIVLLISVLRIIAVFFRESSDLFDEKAGKKGVNNA